MASQDPGSRATDAEKLIDLSTPIESQELRSNDIDLSLSPPCTPIASKTDSTTLPSSSKIAASTDKLLHPSTPPRKRELPSESLDLEPPPAPKKRGYGKLDPPTEVFCCNSGTFTQFVTDNDVFAEFKQAAAEGIYMLESWKAMAHRSVDHLIEVAPAPELRDPRFKTRYFVGVKILNEYREIACDGFEFFKESTRAELTKRDLNHCEYHRYGYYLSKFERTEMEGVGLKDAELSPQQFSREKRQVMVRKFSQGRKEEIDEIERKLTGASKEMIEEVSMRVTSGRKEEVAEVVRRLNSSKPTREGDVDLHLARVNMYYADSSSQ